MTAERPARSATAVSTGRTGRAGARRRRPGPLGWRLFAAFVLVAFTSVGVLTTAALIGTERGLSAARQADRQSAAARTAEAAARAYTRAQGWSGADLGEARAVAAAAGARLVLRDGRGTVVFDAPATGPGPGGPGRTRASDPTAGPAPGRGGPGPGAGAVQGAPSGGRTVRVPVTVDERTVGSVTLLFGDAGGSPARHIAWSWIAVAGVAALAVALAASWFVTRRLTAPLVRVADTARAIASGERSARSGVRAPGELGELSRAFDAMADQLTRAEAARRHLAADVAHELRTPLAALQAGLEELRDGLAEPHPGRLAQLHDQVLRLGRIIGDLAELSAAESGELSLHPGEVDLVALARSALADRGPELRASGLQVRTVLPPDAVRVRADRDRLHQALDNLLSNAARYCRPGDTVTVTVAVRGELALIEVADTGPGIAADELPHVFDRLWHGRAGGTVHGSGIGLAIVREVARAHGGTVHAASGASGGATFTVALPGAHGAGSR